MVQKITKQTTETKNYSKQVLKFTTPDIKELLRYYHGILRVGSRAASLNMLSKFVMNSQLEDASIICRDIKYCMASKHHSLVQQHKA